MDDDEIKNEVTQLEYENEEGMNDGTIEESLGHTYVVLAQMTYFLNFQLIMKITCMY